MFYAYVLETVAEPKHYYVGSTEDLTVRLADHNAERSPHAPKIAENRLQLRKSG